MKLFHLILNQHKILRFLIPILNMFQQNCFGLYQHFLLNAGEMAQKPKTYFFLNVSKNLIWQRPGRFRFVKKKSKSLLPNAQAQAGKIVTDRITTASTLADDDGHA